MDEYQDINLAQFELLKLLAPLRSSVTIVADDDQSIYGWRGAKPELIDTFIQRYTPHIVKLDTSYRCPDTILYGAQRLIVHQRSQERQRFMRSQVEGGPPIFHYIFDDVRQEQHWLVALIDKLIKERNHKPGDIAILYRTHRLAEPAEQALIQAGFKVHRLHKESFFDEPVTRDVVRYLQLAQAINEETFAAALNFPLRLVDELTMVQLRRLAETQGISLIDLTRRIDDYSEVSPLTRAHLQRFLNLLEQRFPQLTVPAESAVRALFDLLEEQRSPWRLPDRTLLEGFMRFTDLSAEADELATAIETDRPIIFVHPPTLDGAAAATILRLTLSDYLGVSATGYSDVEIAAVDLPPNAFVVLLGDVDLTHDSTLHPHIRLPRPGAEHPYALATLAWRCAQLLLVGYETLADGRYVVYDIETTGTNVRRDEIVEIAAATYEDQQAVGEPFHRFVRPQRNYIPHAATNVHGIRYEDVADAPTIPQVLPEFLDYVGAETLVGHNIARFDNRFVDRACGEQLDGQGFHPIYVDTLRLGRRLLPGTQHSLEQTLQALALDDRVAHRARDDVSRTAEVFFALADRIVLEKEIEALSDYLPLVALGALGAGIELRDENLALVHGAARCLARPEGQEHLENLLAHLPPDVQVEARSHLPALAEILPPRTEEDEDWEQLRQEFLTHVTSFQRYGADASLSAFLDYQALLDSTDTFAHVHSDEQITLMTLHNAKGTEFPVVIIIGVEQENLPLWRALGEPEQVAEERRVLYVGITRARESVYLFSVRDRNDGFSRNPSRFAFEIPSEYIRRFRVDAPS